MGLTQSIRPCLRLRRAVTAVTRRTIVEPFWNVFSLGLVFPNRQGKPLNPSNIRNRVIDPLLKKKGLPFGGCHIFRRFRMTWLRENSVPADIERFWLGHANRTVSDDYSMLKFRKQIADRIGAGFSLPGSILAPVVPNVPKTAPQADHQVVAQVIQL
jgi:integrase